MNLDTEYLETYYEIVAAFHFNSTSKFLDEVQQEQGRGGMWEYAQTLTNEFQELHKDREWDGDFYDELDNFLIDKI